MILNVKVHAIRDAQLEEKKLIKQEIKEEDKRLDLMMEIDRVNAIKIQEEIEKKRKVDMKQGAKVILKQIEENRQEKLIKDEVKEQENAAMLTYLEQLQKQDYEEALKRKEKAKTLSVNSTTSNILEFILFFIY